MNNTATEQMLFAVQMAQENADQAEKEFQHGAKHIQSKASQSIDLFGGSATSQVADIASESRKICDALYAAYQTLVKMLDSQCRPLLDQKPQIHAVRAVRDLIKWLNDESEIENNFTASLNAHNLGDVASVRYIPSIENKMIQSFWEVTYQGLPDREDFERREQERAKEDVKLRKQMLDDLRATEVLEQEAYHRSVVDWETAAKEVENRRSQKLKEALAAEEASLRERYLQTRDATVSALEKEKAEVEKRYASAKVQRASTSFFDFAEKKQLKTTLETLGKKLASIDESIKKAKNDYEQALANLDDVLESKKASIEDAIGKALPMPAAPAPLYKKGTTFKDVLVEALQERGGMWTIQEIVDFCPEAQKQGYEETTRVLRSLLGCGVERVTSQRQAYFRATEERPPEESTILELLQEMKIATFCQLANDPKLAKVKVKKISIALCVLLDRGKVVRYLQNGSVCFQRK